LSACRYLVRADVCRLSRSARRPGGGSAASHQSHTRRGHHTLRRGPSGAECYAHGKECDAHVTLFAVDHPEQFPLAAAVKRPTTSELVVTGAVTPDVSRNVPVVSLASGRVTAIHARLG